jgi:hypothetical protein
MHGAVLMCSAAQPVVLEAVQLLSGATSIGRRRRCACLTTLVPYAHIHKYIYVRATDIISRCSSVDTSGSDAYYPISRMRLQAASAAPALRHTAALTPCAHAPAAAPAACSAQAPHLSHLSGDESASIAAAVALATWPTRPRRELPAAAALRSAAVAVAAAGAVRTQRLAAQREAWVAARANK